MVYIYLLLQYHYNFQQDNNDIFQNPLQSISHDHNSYRTLDQWLNIYQQDMVCMLIDHMYLDKSLKDMIDMLLILEVVQMYL
jgi:hypothetical protein